MSALTFIPSGEHFAIITTDTIYIPGDERSRTHPGHGYPESTETVIKYEAITNKDDLAERIKELNRQNKSYRVLSVKPVKINISVDVTVG